MTFGTTSTNSSAEDIYATPNTNELAALKNPKLGGPMREQKLE